MIVCANPSAQFDEQTEIEEAVLEVMHNNRYVLGEEVASLEKEFTIILKLLQPLGWLMLRMLLNYLYGR